MSRRWFATACAAAVLCAPLATHAAPKLRLQVEQKGDFVLFGNTLAQECRTGTPEPVVGTVGDCGTNVEDTAPDVFWRSEDPGSDEALADVSIGFADARSTAILSLPAGATVTHAFLYWASISGSPDLQIVFSRPDGFTKNVDAIDAFISSNSSYQAVADVTSIVKAQGPGAYRVSDVKSLELADADSNSRFAGWWVAVFYTLATDPPRNLALFDGLDYVANGAPTDVDLQGLLVPPAFGQAKLGVVAFEGDGTLKGDSLAFNGAPLSNGLNPVDNFFNGTRTTLGQTACLVGDLPELAGTPESMSGMDMDVVDITSTLVAGEESAQVEATSTGDTYHLAGFVTSIPAFKPDFMGSPKSAEDLDGAPTLSGHHIEYTIVAKNDGNDDSAATVVEDLVPEGAEYVAGTLEIVDGPGAGPQTDAAGDDQCEYDSFSRTVTCRVGTGADAMTGGGIAVGESVTVKFRVQIEKAFAGVLPNQAKITAAGLQGALPVTVPTDGDAAQAGSQSTDVLVDECASDADCPAKTPHCKTDASPNVCVQCLGDKDCPGLSPVCDPQNGLCVCVPSGMEVCDGLDNDCNGKIDEGLDLGAACSNGVGACATNGKTVCGADGAVVCDAVPGMPGAEICGDGLDSDCDGNPENGCDGVKNGNDGGCGCSVPSAPDAAPPIAAGLFAVLSLFGRRRRRR
ncbi:MAG: MopE-related protein [Polyangiaceae bacterium]